MKKKKNKKWVIFRLKLNLYKVVIMKNLPALVAILLMIFLICSLNGLIPKGVPFFGELSTDLQNWYKNTFNTDKTTFLTIAGIFSSITSLSFAYGYFKKVVHKVTLGDIKTEKVRRLLQSVNLDINEHGHIITLLEKETDLDLDGDNIVNNKKVDPSVFGETSLMEDVIGGVSEIITVSKLKITPIVEANADAFNVKQEEEQPKLEEKKKENNEEEMSAYERAMRNKFW